MLIIGSPRFTAFALLMTFSTVSSGCYKNVAIRPDQIPHLSGMPSPMSVAESGNTTILVIPVATVLAPDGTNIEVSSPYDLLVRLGSGQEYTFEHPVRGTLDGGVLDINAANRSATRFNLRDVREALVTQSDNVAAVLLGLALAAVVILAVAVPVFLLD